MCPREKQMDKSPYLALVIDMQREFWEAGMNPRIEPPYANRADFCARINRVLAAFRARELQIVYVATHFTPEAALVSPYCTKLCGPYCVGDDPGGAILSEITDRESEPICCKHGYDAFAGDTADAQALRAMLLLQEVEQVVLMGVKSEVCVLQTALGAFDLGVNVMVVRDCVTTTDPADHVLALLYMQHYAAARLLTSEQLIAELS